MIADAAICGYETVTKLASCAFDPGSYTWSSCATKKKTIFGKVCVPGPVWKCPLECDVAIDCGSSSFVQV